MISDRGCVYRMKRIGQSTEPWGTPYDKEDGSHSRPRTETVCFLPLRYDQKNARAVSRIQKTSLKQISSKSWSIVSNAALRSRRVKTEMWSESLQVKKEIFKDTKQGCLCAVLRSIRRQKNMPQIVAFEVYKQLRKNSFFFSRQFWHKRQVWHRFEVFF